MSILIKVAALSKIRSPRDPVSKGPIHYADRFMQWGDINPLDPNPAIAACVVFPQSGHSRPEKQPFFHIFPHFSKIEPSQKYYGPIYQIKAGEMQFQTQRKLFRFDKQVCPGKILNFNINSKFWGNLEGNRGNPGEMPHIG